MDMELPATVQENRKLYNFYYGTHTSVLTAVDALTPYLEGVFSEYIGNRASRLLQKLEEAADYMDHIGRHMFQKFDHVICMDHWAKNKPRYDKHNTTSKETPSSTLLLRPIKPPAMLQ